MAKRGRPPVFYDFPDDVHARSEYLGAVIRRMIELLEREKEIVSSSPNEAKILDVALWLHEHAPDLAEVAALAVMSAGMRRKIAAGHSQTLARMLGSLAERDDDVFVNTLISWSHAHLRKAHESIDFASSANRRARDQAEDLRILREGLARSALHTREAQEALTLLRSDGPRAAADYVTAVMFGYSTKYVTKARARGVGGMPRPLDESARIPWFPVEKTQTHGSARRPRK